MTTLGPRQSFDIRISEIREALTHIVACVDALDPPEFRPSGFACTVERDPAGVTLVVRMRSANISLPLPADRARELASLLLVGAETIQDSDSFSRAEIANDSDTRPSVGRKTD